MQQAANWVVNASSTVEATKVAESFRAFIENIIKRVDSFDDATRHVLAYPVGENGRDIAKRE